MSTDTRSNLVVVRKLLLMVVVMFAFGYAMVPIYNKICQITGINFLTKPDQEAGQFAKNTQVDTSRKIKVVFDSNSRGAWQFSPEFKSVTVHPGELVTVVYDLVNTSDQVTVGQAIPSYAPKRAAGYFRKIQCFCFDQQQLGPNGTQKFPVVFVIDPDLPADVHDITLSYTYFQIEGVSAKSPGKADES